MQEEFKPSDVIEYLDPYLRMASNHYHFESRLNGKVLEKSDVHRLKAWKNRKVKSISLQSLDRMLSDYRLHISDFELFLEEKHAKRVPSNPKPQG